MSAENRSRTTEGAGLLELRLRVVRGDFTLDVEGSIDLDCVTAVFGPSGSGKSTLLRAIAGFESPHEGRIAFGDEVWLDTAARRDLPAHRRAAGMLFQDARLFDHLDVEGNLAFAEKRRTPTARRFARDEVVTALDLTSLLSRRVTALSGGERQRVALARTLLSSPRLLLLDEPLSGLDRERKAEILPYLEEVIRRFALPTLFVSHDIDEVVRLADRVWVVSEGRLQTEGPIATIVERLDLEPLTGRFEAGVVVEGRVVSHDPRLHLTRVDVHGDAFTMPLLERLAEGDPVRMRIRARDVALAIQRPEGLSIRNVVPGQIADLVPEPETGSALAFVQLRGDRIQARLTLAAVEELGLEAGSRVYALIKSVSFERAG